MSEVDRHRVRDRGPRRRRARPGRREPVLRAAPRRASTDVASTICSPTPRRAGASSPSARPNDLAHAAAFRAERHAVQHEQIARLGERLPLPQIELPFLFTPDIGRAAGRRARRRARDAGSSSCDDRASDPELVAGTACSSAAAAAASARRRSRRCSRSKARARAATRAWSRSTPPSGSPTRSGSRRSPTRRARSTATRWDDDGSAKPDGDALGADARHEVDVRPARDRATRRLAEQAQRILDNRFYRNVSGALGGTQEYMAMEKLHELHDERRLRPDRVDTPPTRHALDFLDAPRRLLRLLDNRIFRMLMMPTRAYLQGRERRGADVPAHRRRASSARRPSTTSSRSSARSKAWKPASATARSRSRRCSPHPRPRSCSSRRRAATRWKRRSSSRSSSRETGQTIDALDREPRAPDVRRRSPHRPARRRGRSWHASVDDPRRSPARRALREPRRLPRDRRARARPRRGRAGARRRDDGRVRAVPRPATSTTSRRCTRSAAPASTCGRSHRSRLPRLPPR